MNNDHLDAHFRVIFDRLTASHRAALEELRDGNAALARAAAKGKLQKDGSRLPEKPKASWRREALHDVIVGALLDYSGTGQGVDDMLFDIASSQAKVIIEKIVPRLRSATQAEGGGDDL